MDQSQSRLKPIIIGGAPIMNCMIARGQWLDLGKWWICQGNMEN